MKKIDKFEFYHLIIIVITIAITTILNAMESMTFGESMIIALVCYLGLYNILCTSALWVKIRGLKFRLKNENSNIRKSKHRQTRSKKSA